MKLRYHLIIVGVIIALIYWLYNDGLGAIPFLLAAVYLGVVSYFDYQKWKAEKRNDLEHSKDKHSRDQSR